MLQVIWDGYLFGVNPTAVPCLFLIAHFVVCEVSCVHATPHYWRHGREED